MRELSVIRSLLEELKFQSADRLEDQDLDFKEWNTQSMDKAVRASCPNGRLYGQRRRGHGSVRRQR